MDEGACRWVTSTVVCMEVSFLLANICEYQEDFQLLNTE